MSRTYSVGEFAKELGVHVQTVKDWCRKGEIGYIRTPGNRRRIPHRELLRLASTAPPMSRVAIYARVSSHDQKKEGDLDGQVKLLKEHAESRGWSVENTYTGENMFGRILITYKDRLTRFGFKYLQRFFEENGVTMTSVKDEVDETAEEELVEDMIKLVASFSGKLYGMRSSKKRSLWIKLRWR